MVAPVFAVGVVEAGAEHEDEDGQVDGVERVVEQHRLLHAGQQDQHHQHGQRERQEVGRRTCRHRRSGQVRSGQVRSGQVRSGQVG